MLSTAKKTASDSLLDDDIMSVGKKKPTKDTSASASSYSSATSAPAKSTLTSDLAVLKEGFASMMKERADLLLRVSATEEQLLKSRQEALLLEQSSRRIEEERAAVDLANNLKITALLETAKHEQQEIINVAKAQQTMSFDAVATVLLRTAFDQASIAATLREQFNEEEGKQVKNELQLRAIDNQAALLEAFGPAFADKVADLQQLKERIEARAQEEEEKHHHQHHHHHDDDVAAVGHNGMGGDESD